MKRCFILLALIPVVGVFLISASHAAQIPGHPSGHSDVKPPKKPVDKYIVEPGEPLHGKGYHACKPSRKKHKKDKKAY